MVWRMVDWKVYRTFLCGQHEPECQQAQGECEPLLERQCLECRESQSGCRSETGYFSHHFFGGSFASRPFFQPPSCRPISPSISANSAYFSVGMSLDSQASWVKNLTKSNFDIALPKVIIFGSIGKYADWNVNSKTERKLCSILFPIPNLSTFGKLRWRVSQNI